jgi:transcriptional regulator with XRE-family HTH domain
MLVGMSQEQLGNKLGLTFQQVQKYEKGSNRISASRLADIAAALSATPTYFFESMPETNGDASDNSENQGEMETFLQSNDGLRLNRAFNRIEDPKVRKCVIDLVRAIADQPDDNMFN